jgi:DNA-binding transcriptional MocR family regulator
MLSLSISRNGGQPLCDQIVAGLKRQIDDRHLRPGTRIPSIRNFTEAHDISRFTVIEAYDRLVAMGYLRIRAGARASTLLRPCSLKLGFRQRPKTTSVTSNWSG